MFAIIPSLTSVNDYNDRIIAKLSTIDVTKDTSATAQLIACLAGAKKRRGYLSPREPLLARPLCSRAPEILFPTSPSCCQLALAAGSSKFFPELRQVSFLPPSLSPLFTFLFPFSSRNVEYSAGATIMDKSLGTLWRPVLVKINIIKWHHK